MIKDKPVPIPTEFIENPDNLDPYIIYRKARELGIFYPDLLEAQLKYLYPTKNIINADNSCEITFEN